jgi:RNA polymerase sigma-70 factor (ECF subfamily)
MPHRPDSDAELVARAAAGDLAAFDRLVLRHRSRLYRIAREITGDADAAQDVVQEALLRSFRALGRLQGKESFGQWLNAIVRRESARWLRNGHRRADPMEPALIQQIAGAYLPPPRLPDEVTERVRAALAELPERERRVMILHYLEDRSCEEIAGIVGLAAGSIKRLLHNSRQKVQKEQKAMDEAKKRGPRKLAVWMSGQVPTGSYDAMKQAKQPLGQSVCLAVNKTAKTIAEISDEVQAHPDYITDLVRHLHELEVLTCSKKDHYVLNFIAFDADDWRRLIARTCEPAAKVAQHLSQAQGRLRAAYEQSTVAQAGWTWEDVIWVVNCDFVAHLGMALRTRAPNPPVRPGGYHYWLGGHELKEGIHTLQTPSWYGGGVGWGLGTFGPTLRSGKYNWLFGPEGQGSRVMHTLLDGPRSEDEVLSRLGVDDRDENRATLAKLVKEEIAVKSAEGLYQLNLPVWQAEGAEALAEAVKKVTGPIAEDLVGPVWGDVSKLLDEMGYGHCRDQFAYWRDLLSGDIMSQALHLLVKQSVLPELGDSPPAKWEYAAWKGDLPLRAV